MMEGVAIGGYRMLRQLGAGGMGVVWLAEHAKIGRKAAIKILHANLTTNPDMVARFFNEAKATTTISDPGIVQIFDYGHAADGSAYIVMELLDGESLDARLKREGGLTIGDSLRFIRQVAASVGAAHVKGIVHRDLKPDNIFIVRDPEVATGERTKVLDFGIAKLTNNSNAITSTSTVMGTPLYMSPEQCRGGGKIDQRSDVYSLGCLLFTLIAGRPPFRARGSGELIIQHVTVKPPRLSSCTKGITKDIDELILRCMSKDPTERYDSGTELATAIDDILSSLSTATANRVSAMVEDLGGTETTLGSSVFVTPVATVAPRRNRQVLVATLGVLVIGGATTAWIVSQRGGGATARVAIDAPPAVAVIEERPTAPRPEARAPSAHELRAKDGIQSALRTFASWAATRSGTRCPTVADLRIEPDPWGTPYEITCVDQPGDQMIGVRSLGPDKVRSDDDLTSWTMGREVTDLVRGTRWSNVVAKPEPAAAPPPVEPKRPQPVKATKPVKTVKPPKPNETEPPKPAAKPGMVDLDGDGIPDVR